MRKKRIRAEPVPEEGRNRILERPDGFYWLSEDRKREYGPFVTITEALDDMQYSADSDYEPGETLEEAEDEIGVSGWVDPETGELAEEVRARLEDH